MIWLRPPAFAWYRQVSARWTSSAVEAPGPRARPPLTVKLMSSPATTTGAAAVAERTLSARIPDPRSPEAQKPRRSLQWVREPADRSIKPPINLSGKRGAAHSWVVRPGRPRRTARRSADTHPTADYSRPSNSHRFVNGHGVADTQLTRIGTGSSTPSCSACRTRPVVTEPIG